ncbi:hydroxyectoine utilization dehydratase EutB [Ochrobactrum sp. MYb15]|uniref:hydroxyectoine utilization dehydratase EutB n=1 Tax=Brucella pituitosa TaxID=571256 RepID=UPI0001C87605|nr:hydroxyectoine utilization dehydratase EutB [Ochrobactrum sp. MYb19]PRA55050.1 hydroxyectoine utilization dehydratase EutB [Ochrobactrum sp. MYb68]PRA68124.1 hydroxyectoine utilization dehydratase EutB [Ochrobactrum sp. MYb18]PRA74648.1 hydroxyectoine utilization dehydratase EutB [Brucella thiophenivorans]PRA90374.1 hydroxyectoine utilization dehydratase EutB [Ochrobactrum sp. MYb14]PRA95825.1 hydroxyectoine utilization dehydratase EutB [Ochrobactrum sp. MYb15]
MISLNEIEQAQDRLDGHVERTPLIHSESLSAQSGVPVFLKLENRQPTGSFKLRGATNAVLSLSGNERERGLVTASTGNHGRALAHAASTQGLTATICLSSLVPRNKVEAIRALGADVRIVGNSQDDAMEEVVRLVRDESMNAIPPFDDPRIIAGQGTMGLEIVEDLPELHTVLVPLSGGGLAAGVAAAVKAKRPLARVIGISMKRGAAMQASLEAGKPVNVEELDTLADSLGGGIGLDNRWTFEMCRSLLDDVILLDEEEITAGIRHAATQEGEVIEGAAAVGIAALLAGKIKPTGATAIIISGGNVDPEQHRAIMENRYRRAG